MRLCPKCGKKSQEARCPDDGTATLVLAQNPDAKLTEGTEVNGRYRIGRMIGQGGFGAVYRAKNLATDQDIAIKLLAVSLDSDDSDMIQRFFAEAQVTASLKHPNTIRVFDFGQTEGGALYIAMELLTGRALNEELKERVNTQTYFQEQEIITIGAQILRSLAEAHTSNLVHRDLKPHNIFLHEVEGDDAVVKVLDFGIAKRLGSNLTGTGKAFGTPTYMSPEQAQNKGLDRRSDLYSLGCVLFQLAAGRPPYDGENPLSVLLSHVADPIPDLRQLSLVPVSEAFVRVIERAMAKNPEDRFANAMEMRQALEGCRGAPRLDPTRSFKAAAATSMVAPAEFDGATDGYDALRVEARTAAYQMPANLGAGATPGPQSPPPLSAPTLSAPPQAGPPPMASASLAVPPPPQGRAPTPLTGSEPVWAPGAIADYPGPAAAEAEEPPPPAKRSAAMAVAIVAVLAAAAGAVVWLATGGLGSSEAVVAGADAGQVAIAEAGDAQGAVANAVDVAPSPAGPGAADAAAGPAPQLAAAGPVQVEVVTEPPGARIEIGGIDKGTTPATVTVTGEQSLALVLHLEGYADKEVAIDRKAAPQAKIALRKLEAMEGKAGDGKSAGGKSGSKSGSKSGGSKTNGSKENSSALEERL